MKVMDMYKTKIKLLAGVLCAMIVFLIVGGAVYQQFAVPDVSLEASDAPLFNVYYIKRMLTGGTFAGANPWVGLGNIGPILIGDYTALCYWLLPAAKVEEVIMLLGAILSALYFFLFLRERKFGYWASLVGGLSLGFCTCLISISKAGHTGKFTGMAYVAGAMWMMQRMLNGKHPFWGLFAGLFVGYAFAQARDLILIVMMGVTVFWLYEGYRKAFVEKTSGWIRTFTLYAVAAVISIIVTYPVMVVLKPGSDGSELAVAAGGGKEDESAAQWEWATQWSLPSDELPKLIIPSYTGYDSWDSAAPYWGRMGRSAGWEVTRQGFRNFTQTNEYLGVTVFSLALIGITGGILRFRRRRLPDAPVNDAVFWLSLGLVSLVLALGNYGFLYQFFYELPMMSSIRNPVKFMHLVSLSVSILCAHGVEEVVSLLRQDRLQLKRVMTVLVPPVLLIIVLAMMLGASPWENRDLVARLNADGFAQQMDGILNAMFKGTLRSLWYAVLVVAAIGTGLIVFKKARGYSGAVCGILLFAIMAFDLVGVNRKYVGYHNPSLLYRTNAVMDYLKKFPAYRCKFIPHNQGIFNLWNSILVPYLAVKSLDMPAESRRRSDIQMFYDSLMQMPARMWSIMGVKHMIIPRELKPRIEELFGGTLRTVTGFSIGQDQRSGIVFAEMNPNIQAAPFLIMQNTEALSFAKWYDQVEIMPRERMYSRMAESTFDINSTILVAGAEDSVSMTGISEVDDSGAVVNLKKYTEGGAVIEVSAERQGWLYFNDYNDGKWKFEINGRPLSVYPANGIFMAVQVPEGNHVITMSFGGSDLSFRLPIYVSLGLLALLAVALSVRFVAARRMAA